MKIVAADFLPWGSGVGAVGGRAHRAQIASSIEWQRIQVKRYEWDDEQQPTKKIDNENTNWQCRSVATPNKENWYNICLQMTCHTFIWLHDWNNQWKLLYRTQILSLASNICILHGANERPWCSYSPYSLSLSLSLRRFLAFSHFGLERNQSKPVKSTTQHQIECIELCRTFGFHIAIAR